jgi:tryptophanyl-tRNA synthetase
MIGGRLRSAERVGTIAKMSTTTPARTRVFSGMRPTGELHIGHLLGALGNWVRLQEEAECIYSVVDLHALTTGWEDVRGIRRSGQLMVADWLAVGIDPERSIIFRQSDISEHAELAALLGMITPLSWLERVPTYKGQLQELGDSIDTFGFLGYPLLQTADIILYKATEVPVGQDQLPHLELAREIVRRFNFFYGEVFPEPQARLAEVPLIMGVDNRKMSKSYGNAITLGASDEEIDRLVGSMITDPQRVRKSDPGRPEICNVWAYHKLFNTPQPALDAIYAGCTSAQLGCVQDKRALAETVKGVIRPIRERRARILADEDRIEQILADGARRAKAIAGPVLDEAKAAMGL